MIEDIEAKRLKDKIDFLKEHHIDKKIEYEIKWILNSYYFENIEIMSRIKDFNSAFFKFKQKKYSQIEELKDLIGVMIICKNKNEIYEIAKIIEDNLAVIQKKDYIKQPKMGYQSIHLKIQNNNEIFYEIQIKTRAMKMAQEVTHDKIYKNQKIPKILRKLLTPIVFNSVLWYDNRSWVKVK